jgi:PKHD-type hydroxylase
MSTKLTNNPFRVTRVHPYYIVYDGPFTDAELERICNEMDQRPTERGRDGGNFRISDISWININHDNSWIFEKLNPVLEKINDEHFQYSLTGYDHIQYSTYSGDKRGRYDWHMDMAYDVLPAQQSENRKMSVSLMLNQEGIDFEGGSFEVNGGSEHKAEKVHLRKGQLVMFPSFLIHRVTPVTKGIRKSLVIWILGPKIK